MIFIRQLSVNKTNCDDLHREFSYEILNWHYLCAFLTFGNSIRFRQNFVKSRIWKNAGFWPEEELDSCAALFITEYLFHSVASHSAEYTVLLNL